MLDRWVPKPPSADSPSLSSSPPEVEVKELKEIQRQAEQAIERARSAKAASRFEKFGKQYYNDPAAFAYDCLNDVCPTPYQAEILSMLPVKKRVCVRGPHGIGKSALASFLAHWYILTRSALGTDFKLATTASAWRQLEKYLWPEIWKTSSAINWRKVGREPYTRAERLLLAVKMRTGSAFAVASDNHQYIEGLHANSVCYIFDESKAIPDPTWQAAEGAFSAAGADTGYEALAFSISTPGEPMGQFYNIHMRKPGFEDWWPRHVQVEEAIQAGRISHEWVEARKRQWGEQSAAFQNRVLGEFCSSDSDAVIPLAWVERAMAWEDGLAWVERVMEPG